MSNFISLYDHLGHAAGSALGKQVADYAALRQVSYQVRHVSNSKYTGEIMLYPAEFLNEFFAAQGFFKK